MNACFSVGGYARILLSVTAGLSACAAWSQGAVRQRPSILLAISDDQSWLHTSISGDRVVQTPTFDRVAREGVLFTHAFCSSPSCTPSRGAILTGQDFWRLEDGANLMSTLPSKFTVYPDLLEAAGYVVGYCRKGWAPGNFQAAGRTRNPAGPRYKSLEAFLKNVPEDKPFCFWFGSSDPHRPYKKGSGLASGKRLEDVVVPPFLPDTPEVRGDILDYCVEIERFDRQVGQMLNLLAKAGRLDNTIVVVTSDNGMPFPRAKTNLYDFGVRMPLAVRWKARLPGGRVVDDFVCLTDLAPTFLEAAQLDVPPAMTGRSLVPLLVSDKAGRVDPKRDRVVVGRERHGWNRDPNVGYPMRAIRTYDHLYIRNFKPNRWPGFDIDFSPTRTFMLEHRAEPGMKELHRLWFEPRPEEELYDLHKDPGQVRNVADDPGYAQIKLKLRGQLDQHLAAAGDPRVAGAGDAFEQYRYFGKPTRACRFYRQFFQKPPAQR